MKINNNSKCFSLICIFNLLCLYGLTDGRPFINCYSDSCFDSSMKTFSYILISFLITFASMYIMQHIYGKENVIKSINKYILYLFIFIIFVFICIILPNAETGNSDNIYNNHKSFWVNILISSISIYIYMPIIGILFNKLTSKKNKIINNKISFLFLFFLIFTISMINLFYL